MKPPPFRYVAADSLDEAVAALAEHGDEAKLLAGGQSLIPMMNFRLARPAVLIDLNRLVDLQYVERSESGGLRVGAMTRQSVLERQPLVAELAPLVTETVPYVAHPQIRNRGTVGGNLAHADPASELPAVALALGARFRTRGPGGERWLAAEEFFTGLLTTALASDELLVEVEFPGATARTGYAFEELARRHGDYAQVGVAVVLKLDENGRCSDARIVYLSVGDTPLAAREAAARLVGEVPDRQTISEAAALAAEREIDPSGDIHASAAYKRHLTRVLTERALVRAGERAAAA